jgi:hypothetical protein
VTTTSWERSPFFSATTRSPLIPSTNPNS